MRSFTASLASTALAAALTGAASAADLPARAPGFAARPLYVFAVGPAPLHLEHSPYTAQPITVIYNEPGRTPWSVAPDLDLVPLPRAKPSRTRAVYPRDR